VTDAELRKPNRVFVVLATILLLAATIGAASVARAEGRVTESGGFWVVEASNSSIATLLRELGAKAGFTVSAQCTPSNCPRISGSVKGSLETLLRWLLQGQSYVLVRDYRVDRAEETGWRRVILLDAKHPPPMDVKLAPKADIASSTKRRSEMPPNLSPTLSANGIQHLLTAAGIDFDRLLTRAQKSLPGIGGPFIPQSGAKLASDAANGIKSAAMVRLQGAVPLMAPIETYRVTSRFGRRPDPLNRRRAFHAGIDLAAPLGTPVRTSAYGRVIYAGWQGGYGRVVEIDHGLGIRTRYAHLGKIQTWRGTVIQRGQIIGRLGRSGRTRGAHLHYEVLLDGKPIDPATFL
jgi:murein DD-endopeptidase MepM/ murein hydrolase activator NlpD